MQIRKVGMIGNHFQPGNANRIRAVVLHSTAGRSPGDYNWLRQGGALGSRVSIHYYIDKAGNISQMVDDHNIAWHAGPSTWIVDGQRINYNVGLNPVSIGIELSNLNNGRDPYPPAQYAAALWLTRQLVAKYNIPRSQLVRHLDIAPQRKTDPAGFPWERFVSEVYSAVPTPPPEPKPPLEPLPPSQQLRKLLIDLAYRAAGGAFPSGWPLLKESVSRQTGMPVAMITAPESRNPAESQDGQSRGVTVAGQPPFIIEAYARDLFYAPTQQPDQIKQLSQTDLPLRDGLLQVLFLSADPANGFKPEWAFHQFYLDHMTEIGVPISSNHRVPGQTSDGRTFACQHFALDTLCSPVGQWSTIIRLSDLTRDMYGADPHQQWEKELRLLVLNDLYQSRTGRVFDQNALFNSYAITRNLGAPLGKAEMLTVDGQRLVAMPFALDVIHTRIPADGDWRNVLVGELPVLGAPGVPDEAEVGQLSALMVGEDWEAMETPVLGGSEDVDDVLPSQIYAGNILGAEVETPLITNLAFSNNVPIELVVVYPTPGPISADLSVAMQPGADRWHYYVSLTGEILQLTDELQIARTAEDAVWQSRGGNPRRFLAIGVESGATALSERQSQSLTWLLQDAMERHRLTREQVIQEADLEMTRIADWGAVLEQLNGT